MKPDTRVFQWEGGAWVKNPAMEARRPHVHNFIVVCRYGDWSGFRTLPDCLAQNPDPRGLRPAGFFWIEER